VTFVRTSIRSLAIAVLLISGIAQAAGGPADTVSVAEQYLLIAANQERAARGLQPLHRDPALARAAARHAEQMAEHGGISHQFPGEPELTSRGASAGVAFTLIEENVAEAPNAAEIHEMWMNSDHHRANLLDPSIDAAGISVVQRGGEFYAVEDFARVTPNVGLAGQEADIAALVRKRAAVSIASSANDVAVARQTCAMDSGYAGQRKPWFIMRFTSASLDRLPEELASRLATGKYHQAAVGACAGDGSSPFTSYNIAVLLFP
jgi:uncharacterized protein YkwD